MRGTVQLLIHLDVEKCLKDGIKLYLSTNRVILTEGLNQSGIIPPSYIAKVEEVKGHGQHKKLYEIENWRTRAIRSETELAEVKYLCILDFEATCEDGQRLQNQEIIEFPSVMLDTKTGETVSVFHEYVKPVINPKLSRFCTELTGITQKVVDEKGLAFAEVLKAHGKWFHEVTKGETCIICTCGDWDLRSMLPRQCKLSNLKVPRYLKRWANVKFWYSDFAKKRANGMMEMLQDLEIKHEGRHHSGIDDCKNIAKICDHMLRRSFKPAVTASTGKSHKRNIGRGGRGGGGRRFNEGGRGRGRGGRGRIGGRRGRGKRQRARGRVMHLYR